MPLGYPWRLFASLLLLGSALAQEVFAPLPGTFFLPLDHPPGPEGCVVRWGLALANHLTYASGPWGEVGFDLEELRLELGLGHRRGAWEVSLGWPLSLYYGGFLDYLLDPLHTALGLPKNEVQGQVLLFARRGGEERRWEGATWGVRDPYLRLDLYLGEGRLFGGLALPLGSPQRFLGSGGFRVLLGAGWRWEGGRCWEGCSGPWGTSLAWRLSPTAQRLRPSCGWRGLGFRGWASRCRGSGGPCGRRAPSPKALPCASGTGACPSPRI
ncbi:hypothetical protein [Thermus tengchongensis]|uniref:hypothetical protein n=1 Tax=Thermus tengchongensis TaxID=1214928 RepID=UPI00056FFA2D|nr:hypothetical protein [Thermus tengchongensis]